MDGRTAGGVFISYSSSDRALVSAAARLLRAGGATVFQDVVDIEFGARWKESLSNALGQCERVMVFWSAAAAKSKWVEQEWHCALEAKKRIVPMLLDDTPLPPPLGEFHGVPDMVDMLRAAMQIAPSGEPSQPTTAPAAPMAPATRSRQRLFAVVGSLATLVVVMAGWIGLQLRTAPQADHSRGPSDVNAPIALVGLPAYVWGMLAGLGVLLILAGVLYARTRRKSAAPVAEPGGSERQLPPPSAEFSALGTRFTSALFNEAPDRVNS